MDLQIHKNWLSLFWPVADHNATEAKQKEAKEKQEEAKATIDINSKPLDRVSTHINANTVASGSRVDTVTVTTHSSSPQCEHDIDQCIPVSGT